MPKSSTSTRKSAPAKAPKAPAPKAAAKAPQPEPKPAKTTRAKAPLVAAAKAKKPVKPVAKPKAKRAASPRRKPIESYLQPVCDIVAGGASVREACRKLDIDEGTFRSFLRRDPEANAQIAVARDMGCDAMADHCREVARGKFRDTVEVQGAKLLIDTDMRLMGKWASQRYGDKVALTGADGGVIKVERVERVIVDPAHTHS